MPTRAAFLSDPLIRLSFTSLKALFLAQSGRIWFSILVRKLLRRASFTSKAMLKNRILEFIGYFNRTMAKPFKGLTKASLEELT